MILAFFKVLRYAAFNGNLKKKVLWRDNDSSAWTWLLLLSIFDISYSVFNSFKSNKEYKILLRFDYVYVFYCEYQPH